MSPWSIEGWRILGVLGAAFLFGLAIGAPGWMISLGFLLLLILQWANLFRLGRWALDPEKNTPPEFTGPWGALLFTLIARSHRQDSRLAKVTSELESIRGFLFSIPDAVIELDGKNHILWINERAREFYGLHPEKDLGQRIDLLLTDRGFTRFLDGAATRPALEMPAPNAPEILLSVQITPVGEGRRLVVARDVTRVHRLETTRRDFVADASHELRTPLTVIAGYLEIMMRDQGGTQKDWAKQLNTMNQQVGRMNTLVGDLLTLSRLETSPEAETTKEVPLTQMLEGIVKESRDLSGDKAHLITLESDSSLRVLGNSKELYSAISNLVFNAVNYTPPGKAVRVRWFRDHGGGCLEIEDEGIGIEAAHIPRLTKRFYRVDTSRSRASGGTGLGLAIVKHVLNLHNAQLSIQSALGRGSTFRCTFPPHRVLSN